MQTEEALASDPVPSPCNGICSMNARSALCDGCLRTIDEIIAWGQADEESRRVVWRAIAVREQDLFP